MAVFVVGRRLGMVDVELALRNAWLAFFAERLEQLPEGLRSVDELLWVGLA